MKIILTKNQWEYIGRTAGWLDWVRERSVKAVRQYYSEVLSYLLQIYRLKIENYDEVVEFLVKTHPAITFQELEKQISASKDRNVPLLDILENKTTESKLVSQA